MEVSEFVPLASGLIMIIGAIVSGAYVISNRPTYKYCDDTFQRKDLHSQEYHLLLEKIAELKEDIQALKNSK